MKKQVVMGSDFAKTRANPSACFVDKTLFIKAFLDNGPEVSLVTRPRRFGKTFNLSMLHYFLSMKPIEGRRSWFEGTLVEHAVLAGGQPCMDHLGQYPVIYLTLKDLRASSYEHFLRSLALIMAELFDRFQELMESPRLSSLQKQQYRTVVNGEADEVLLQRSLWLLTQLLVVHHDKRVVILIDEYDTPVQEAYAADSPFHHALLDFFRVWMGSALKDNPHLERGLLTGVLRLALMNLFSGVNSIPVHSLLDHHYAPYFGFTEEEVLQLLDQTHLSASREDIRSWYNGYVVGESTLYNPWSVLSCIQSGGLLRAYWSGSGDHGALAKAMLACQDSRVMEGLTRLLSEEASIEVPLDELTLFSGLRQDAASVWGLMVYTGYLSVLEQRSLDQTLWVRVRVPNHEVMQNLRRVVKDWVSYASYPRARALAYAQEANLVDSLVLTLEQGNVEHLTQLLEAFLMEVASYYDFHQNSEERFYHVFLLGISVLIQDRYRVYSNKEVGLGRFDLALSPRDPQLQSGIIIELKRAQSLSQLDEAAESAIAQIVDKRYVSFFAGQSLQKVLYLGLAFCGKSMAIKHQWVEGGD